MKRIALIAATMALVVLSGCTGLDQIIGGGAAADTRKAAAAAIAAYADVVQPSMLVYKALPDCGATQLPTCKTAEGVAKIQATDRAVVPVINAANATLKNGINDPAALMAVVNAVTNARAELSAAGLVGVK